MADTAEKYVVDKKGRRTAVIVATEKYEQLMEDLHDLAVVAERRDEGTLTFDELKRRLKKHGLL